MSSACPRTCGLRESTSRVIACGEPTCTRYERERLPPEPGKKGKKK